MTHSTLEHTFDIYSVESAGLSGHDVKTNVDLRKLQKRAVVVNTAMHRFIRYDGAIVSVLQHMKRQKLL